MTNFRNKSVLVIRNLNLDIVWDLVLGDWCFSSVATISLPFSGKFYS
jgi:hypothetical protein